MILSFEALIAVFVFWLSPYEILHEKRLEELETAAFFNSISAADNEKKPFSDMDFCNIDDYIGENRPSLTLTTTRVVFNDRVIDEFADCRVEFVLSKENNVFGIRPSMSENAVKLEAAITDEKFVNVLKELTDTLFFSNSTHLLVYGEKGDAIYFRMDDNEYLFDKDPDDDKEVSSDGI